MAPFGLVIALIAFLITPSSVLACNGSSINSCTATCSSNCFLLNNLNCTDGQGITLNSGADFDMCGHTLTCTSTACASKPAVTMTANGSRIYNSEVGNTEGGFSGVWLPAVDCASKGSSRVDHVQFVNQVDIGAKNCALVENNYFENSGAFAVSTTTVANSDSINDNYFVGGLGFAIYAAGSHQISIDHNIIELDGSSLSGGITIADATGTMTVSGNIVMSVDSDGTVIVPPSAGGVTTIFDGNYCESAITNCASCRSNGYCATPKPGFVFP
jgi:hypothetical protein